MYCMIHRDVSRRAIDVKSLVLLVSEELLDTLQYRVLRRVIRVVL